MGRSLSVSLGYLVAVAELVAAAELEAAAAAFACLTSSFPKILLMRRLNFCMAFGLPSAVGVVAGCWLDIFN